MTREQTKATEETEAKAREGLAGYKDQGPQGPQESFLPQPPKSEGKSRKALYRQAIDIAWPSVLESVFLSLAGMIDTYMVSGLGPAAVAAVGLTTQPKFLFLSPFIAISIALSALVARRKGEGNLKEANQVLVTSMAMNLVISILISLICVVWADDIIRLAGSNAETHQMAVEYFAIIMGGSIFGNIDLFINSSQRGTGNTRLSLYSNLASTFTNICFNYMLIGGHWGFPALGVRGAAIATVLGTVVGSLVSFRSLFHQSSYLRMSYIRRKKLKPTRPVFRSIGRLSVTYLVENLLMRVGFIITAWKAAELGTEPFAAHQVGMNILNMGFALASGMEAAAVTLVGQSLGAEKKDRAIRYGNICQRIGWVCDAIFVVILFVSGRSFYEAHFTDPGIIDMGVVITYYVMVIAFLQMVQVVYAGCLRAAGDIRYTLIADTVSVTIIRSAATFLLVDGLHLGINGIWIGIFLDQFSRVIFMAIRYHQGKWVDLKI